MKTTLFTFYTSKKIFFKTKLYLKNNKRRFFTEGGFVFIKYFIIFLFFTSFSEAMEKGCQHTRKEFRCVKYLNNSSSHTIAFQIPNVPPLKSIATVLIPNITPPRIRTTDECEAEMSEKAYEFVKTELQNAKRIDLVDISKKQFFRMVADIEYDGKSLRDELLKRGYAYEYLEDTEEDVDWCEPLNELMKHFTSSLKTGRPTRTRTSDPPVMSRML